MKRIIFSLCLCVSVAVLCGCGVGKPMLLAQESVVGQISEKYPLPLAYKVGIEVSIAENEGSRGLIESTELNRVVAEALDGTVFKRACMSGSSGLYGLKVRLTDFELKYAGRSIMIVPSILVWSVVTPVACMLLGDETYTATGQVRVVLDDENAEELWAADFEVNAECNLSDIQRGWNIWDLYFPGPFVARPNVKDAGRHVLPHFYRDIQVKLLETIRDKPIPPPVTDYALVIGVEEFSEDVDVQFAVQDAQAVSATLRESTATYLEGTLVELTGTVTAEEIQTELEQLGRRRDVKLRNVLVYYAGCGQVVAEEEGAKHCLLTSTGPIDLEELVKRLSGLDADSCAVVLDCGFSGESGRCVPFEGDVPEYPEEVMKSEDVGVLFGCSPGQSAFENAKASEGVLTGVMLGHLKQFQGTRVTTLRKLCQQIRFQVSRHARLCGAECQEPTTNATDAIILPPKDSEK